MNWKPITGYEKRYEVSDQGEVQSIKKNPPLMLKPVKHGAGYLAVNLYNGTKGSAKKCYIHDLVAEAFIGPKPTGWTVNHKDGVKTNNTVANLEYLTLSDNLRHAHRTGLIDNRGENNGQAKLTNPDVYQICSGLWSGHTMGNTAESHGVSVATVWCIWNGRTWVHHTSTFTHYMPAGLMTSGIHPMSV